MATQRPIFTPSVLESICKIIGDSSIGLTGTEIGQLLVQAGIEDITPGITKWKRLYSAFGNWQNNHHCSNYILKFIQEAFQPVRYVGNETFYHDRLLELNKRLSFIGVELADTGKFREINKSNTISEAEQRSSRFKHKLENRDVHTHIFTYCLPELLVQNYFHAVFEATKSIADRLRVMTGLHADGNALVETAFSTTAPMIRINLLQTDTDRSEHIGLSNLIKGVFGMIRNATAHAPKLTFPIEEEQALDMMTVISYIHKRLDRII